MAMLIPNKDGNLNIVRFNKDGSAPEVIGSMTMQDFLEMDKKIGETSDPLKTRMLRVVEDDVEDAE